MQKNYLFRKGMVLGIIVLLVGMGFIPAIGGTISEQNDEDNTKERYLIQSSYSDSSKQREDTADSFETNEYDAQSRQQDLINMNIQGYSSYENDEESYIEGTEAEILTIHYDEDIHILENGAAKVDLSLDVPQSELCNMYKEMYGVTHDVQVDEVMMIPEESKMIEKEDHTVFSTNKKSYYKSFTEEQWYSLGLYSEPYDSYLIPRNQDDSFNLATSANAQLNVQDLNDDVWTIKFGTHNDPETGGSYEYLISHVSYSKLLLESIPGNQIFKRTWTTRIHLPEKATMINRDDISGKHWLIDFLQGTYMSATISVESDSTVIIEEVLVVTEPEKINPTYFGDYKSFELQYELPGSPKAVDKDDYFTVGDRGSKLDLTWTKEEGVLFDESFPPFTLEEDWAEVEVLVNMSANCSGKITSKRAWVEVNFEAEATLTISFVAEYEDAVDPKLLFGSSTFVNIPAGPVPIVVQITFSVRVGFDYGVTVSSTAVAYAFAKGRIKLGAVYDWCDGWEKIWDYDFTCGITPPDLKDFLENVDITVWGKPWIGFPVSARIYGLIGPQIEPKIYVLISFGIRVNLLSGNWDTFWSIILGFSVDVGVVVGIYKVWEEEWGFEILNFEIIKWDSDNYDPTQMPPELDEDPPITTILLFSPPMFNISGEWWTGRTATFSISAKDYGDVPSGLGLYGTEYYAGIYNDTSIPTSNYDHAWGVLNKTTYPVGTNPGYYPYYIRAYSVDNNTNIEAIWRKKEINVDLMPPTSEISYTTPVYAYETPITLSSDDETAWPDHPFVGTGSKITYRIGDGTEANWTDWIVGEWDTDVVLYLTRNETVEIEWFAGDGVWNNETIKNVVITDVQLPIWLNYYPYDTFSTDESSELDWYYYPLSAWHNRSVYFNLSLSNDYKFIYGAIKSYHPADPHSVYVCLFDEDAFTWVTLETIDKAAGDDNFSAFGIVVPSDLRTKKMNIYSTCSESHAVLKVAEGLILHEDHPPNTPGNPKPTNGAVDVPVSNVYLNWTGGDPDRRDNVTYKIYLKYNDPDFTGVDLNGTIGPCPPSQTQFNYPVPGQLHDEKTYYWKIVANDTYNETLITEGPVWHFTTSLPPLNVYVDDDYYDGGTNDGHTWGDDAFDNIQDGIYRVREGGTVHVYDGNYSKSTTFKSITLKGNGSATTIVDGKGSGTGIFVGSYAGSVNISGFTIQNCSSGIRIHSDNVHVFHNNITNMTDTGIFIDNDYCNISYNNITKIGIHGVELDHSHHTTLYRNIIKNVGSQTSGYGIESYVSTDNIILSNTIQKIGLYGIYLFGSSHNEMIDNTVKYCNNTGIILSWESDHCTLRDNYVAGSDQPVSSLISILSTYNTIEDNTVFGGTWGSEYGIYIGNNNNNLTKNNKVHNNTYGIYIGANSHDINVVNNTVYDNTYGIYLYYQVDTRINITHNKLHDPSHQADNTQVYGVYLTCSDYINLSNNTANYNEYGFYLYGSHHNNIRDNKAYATTQSALYLQYSSRNTIVKNELKPTREQSSTPGGIMLDLYCNYNTIYHNWINGSTVAQEYGADGIYLQNSHHNDITYNILNNNYYGIKVISSQDNKIMHNEVTGTYSVPGPTGIHLATSGQYDYCYRNNISHNTIIKNNPGIYLTGRVWLNKIYRNTLDSNDDYLLSADDYAIYVYDTTLQNNITWNTIIGNNESQGLLLNSSSNQIINNNDFTDTGITIRGNSKQHWNRHTITNNTANGKPIRYYKDINWNTPPVGWKTVPSDTSQVILAGCKKMKINGLTLDTRVDIPIQLGFSHQNNITNNMLINIPNNRNDYGIYLKNSDCINISGNQIEFSRYDGILLEDYSDSNWISSNIIRENGRSGIKLDISISNLIFNNLNISNNNEAGISVHGSRNTRIVNNDNIYSNGMGVYLEEINWYPPPFNQNIISGNNFYHNAVGIKGARCTQLNITRNLIQGHPYIDQWGIWLVDSGGNDIHYNYITQKLSFGLLLENSTQDYNRIYFNNIVNNGVQASDDSYNIWNDTYSNSYPHLEEVQEAPRSRYHSIYCKNHQRPVHNY
jgi:parallel beta-helix repeat protein